ncbi:class IIb bacteriocin, lactobin A/cerein 7B family [Labilibaculum sp. DW002]|uniref:Class IIb bacteriocin, lactobin A/cerein 7B family n=1 Tax=Paralabilibaculum antarcticum TaxID=2912572 RepID=A0ABT5W031_9BACT|nr:class IIb bacteriocin, lactobin A/cerein 7B family [Labilibaculum sp. DW002]MDE5420193.1 class IIb bacteriocin, lactobin A/cerein 7B family [Labilibaculum sp. DW002]
MKDLNEFGVKEMNSSEMKNVDGGFIEWALGVICGLALDIAFNPKSSREHFMKGVNSYESVF